MYPKLAYSKQTKLKTIYKEGEYLMINQTKPSDYKGTLYPIVFPSTISRLLFDRQINGIDSVYYSKLWNVEVFKMDSTNFAQSDPRLSRFMNKYDGKGLELNDRYFRIVFDAFKHAYTISSYKTDNDIDIKQCKKFNSIEETKKFLDNLEHIQQITFKTNTFNDEKNRFSSAQGWSDNSFTLYKDRMQINSNLNIRQLNTLVKIIIKAQSQP